MKRFLVFVLCISMSLGLFSVTTFADENKVAVSETAISSVNSAENTEAAENTESDSVIESASKEASENEPGSEANDNSQVDIQDDQNEILEEETLPTVTAADVNGDERLFKISLTDYTPAEDETVRAHIWSESKGTDSLQQIDMLSEEEGVYTCDFDPSVIAAKGKYFVEIYGVKGRLKALIASTTFKVSAAACDGVEVSDINVTAGTCRVTAKNITCPSGIKEVKAKVWSQSNKKDAYIYTLEKAGEDSNDYIFDLDIKNHNCNSANYKISVYAVNGNDIKVTYKTREADLSFVDGKFKVTKGGEALNIQISGMQIYGKIKKIKYAVWSSYKGQDDLTWYKASYDKASNTAVKDIDYTKFKKFGEYNVHAYAVDSNGNEFCVGSKKFTLKKAQIGNVAIDTNQTTGKFRIRLSDITADTGITSVRVAVWRQKDQSDIRWYDAALNYDGTYVVSSNISKHKYALGTYNAHIYVTDKRGVESYITETTFKFKAKSDGITLGEGKNERYYPVTLSGLVVPGGEKEVKFAAWSKSDKSDIFWYTATKEGTDYVATIDIKNHKTAGNYTIYAYAVTKGNKKVKVASNKELSVNPTATVTVEKTGQNDPNGTFDVAVTLVSRSSTINAIKIGAWVNSDKSDLAWYTAKKDSEGRFAATIDADNHKFHLGTYKLEIKIIFSNGIQKVVKTTSYKFNPKNYAYITGKEDSGKRTVIIKNPTYSGVRYAVWSEKNGQDDIFWLDASKNSKGNYSTVIDAKKLKDKGICNVHIYSGDECVGTLTCKMTKKDVGKTGWYYKNGYKFYYKDGEIVKDVSKMVSGPYWIRINRERCVITIYAYDNETGQYCIPVKAMTCSVGLPGMETPTGDYSIGNKWRWKQLMGPSYGQYVSNVIWEWGIHIHAVAGPIESNYNISHIEYNRLGEPASHGCIRLSVIDAKWIFENCPTGTSVNIYDSSYAGPFGKPATIKIPEDQNWDPTDPEVKENQKKK